MSVLETLSPKAGQFSGRGLIAAFKMVARNFAKLDTGTVTASGAAYTLGVADIGKTVLRTSASAQTVSLPSNSAADIPIGAQVRIIAQGAGALTIQAGSGATMEKMAATTGVIIAKGAVVATKVAANTWNVSGDLTASA